MIVTSKLFARTAIAALILCPSLAYAELKSEMAAFVVTTDQNGLEQYVEADSVQPGQVIEYRLSHTNGFDNAIGGVAILGPVPEGSELIVGQTTTNAAATFEVRGEFNPDQSGEEWSTLPAQRIVVKADGTRMIEDAKPEHFTAVRWKLAGPMQEDATVQNAYRVQVK